MKKTIKDLKDGQWVIMYFAVKATNQKKSKNNRDYFVFDLYDGTGSIKGYLWNELKTGAAIKPNCYVLLKGYIKSLNNTRLIQIKKIRIVSKEEVDHNRPHEFASNEEMEKQQSLWSERDDDLFIGVADDRR